MFTNFDIISWKQLLIKFFTFARIDKKESNHIQEKVLNFLNRCVSGWQAQVTDLYYSQIAFVI